MPPNDGSGQAMQMARERIDLLRQKLRAIPAPVKTVLVAAVLVLVVMTPFLWGRVAYLIIVVPLLYGPVAVARRSRSVLASVGVGIWGLAVISIAAAKFQKGSDAVPLLLLPVAVVLAAHARPLARAFVPCRTVALVLAWSLPPAVLAWWLDRSQPAITYLIAWGLAVIVLGWRLGKAWQVARGGHQAAGPRRDDRVLRERRAGTGRACRAGGRTRGAWSARPTACAARWPPPARGTARRPARNCPLSPSSRRWRSWTQMIGLEPVKDQIRQLTASVEAARAAARGRVPDREAACSTSCSSARRAPARPRSPGSSPRSTTPSGYWTRPTVVEAQRADLVGEYLGATAIKTNELIDSALGGVLFIDEAYSLVNDGEGQSDRFGNEAVQALLKRAEDDRENLVVILAGYERQMEDFLASNPGLNSRFAIRVRFAGYSPAELFALAAGGPGAARRVARRRRRCAGAAADDRGRRPAPARRRAGQRPVRPQPDGEGRPGTGRAGDERGRGAGRRRPGDDAGRGPAARVRGAELPVPRLRGGADAGEARWPSWTS